MRTDLTPEALAALDAKAAAATPGPWDWTITTDRHWSYVQADDGSGDLYTVAGAISDDDNAAFLAAADPSTVRALLAALTEARAEVAAFQAWKDESAWVAEVMRVRGERNAAEARLAAVRALHQETFGYGNGGVVYSRHRCTCEQTWPCATVRAIEGES